MPTISTHPPAHQPINQASKHVRQQATSHLDGCQAAACHCSHTTKRICCTVLLLVGGSRRQYKPTGASLLILNRPGVMLIIATHPPHTPARPPARQPASNKAIRTSDITTSMVRCALPLFVCGSSRQHKSTGASLLILQQPRVLHIQHLNRHIWEVGCKQLLHQRELRLVGRVGAAVVVDNQLVAAGSSGARHDAELPCRS